MTWKDKLTTAVSVFTMVICCLFTVGWILNALGVLKVDLPILVQVLQVIPKFLDILLGGV